MIDDWLTRKSTVVFPLTTTSGLMLVAKLLLDDIAYPIQFFHHVRSQQHLSVNVTSQRKLQPYPMTHAIPVKSQ